MRDELSIHITVTVNTKVSSMPENKQLLELQVLATSAIGLCISGQCSSWTYPAAALPQMDHPNSTINFTTDQASWFASVTLMMCIPGSVIGATFCEMVGPRRLYIILVPLMWLSMSFMNFASWKVIQDAGLSETLLLILRVLQGCVAALMHSTGLVYMYEISDRRLRGTMTSLGDAWSTSGYLLTYICGCFLSWYNTAWVLPLITLVPGYIGLLWSPESPLWLARKGRLNEALVTLNLFRRTVQEASEDLKVTNNSAKENESFAKFTKLLTYKPNALAVIASCATTIMKEMVGMAVLAVYVVHIFEAADAGLDSKYSSVIVGCVRLICNSIASFLLHHFRRKSLLISGNILAGVAAGAIGIFFHFQSLGSDLTWFSWVPLVSLILHMIGCAAAIGPTSWVVAMEVLPGPVRSVGFGLSVTCFSIAAFVMSKTFVTFRTFVGISGLFWFFAGSNMVFILLSIFFLPETFGKSLKDVEDYWSSK